MSRTESAVSGGAVLVLCCALVTAVVSVLTELYPGLPRLIQIIAVAVTGLSGIATAARAVWPRRLAPEPTPGWPPSSGWPSPSGPPYPAYGVATMAVPPLPGPARSAGVKPFWVGATVVFGLLSLAFAPSALVMVFTGLMAFRRPKAAAGVAVALTLVVLLLGAVAVLVFVLDTPGLVSPTPYEVCVAQGYDPYACSYDY